MNEGAKSGMVRAFLACDPPEEVRRGIAVIQNRLKKQFGGAVRWVRPEGIHLTLKFFGDIPISAVETIGGVVNEHVRGLSPLTLQVQKIGAFPNAGRPRVVWLGVTGDVGRLAALQKKIDAGLQVYGFEREERGFSPHLTLGRVKSPHGMAGLGKIIEEGNAAAGEFQARELILFKSDLRPDGAVYTKLASFPF